MRFRRAFAAVLGCLLWALPAPASAGELRPPVPGKMLIAFGVPCAVGVHRGLDLAAAEGQPVSAPVAGTVSFAGRLPSEGGEVLGVTIVTSGGLKVTCLPLTSLHVEKGRAVSAGSVLGELAAEGDASSRQAHVHLSVRQGETYLDPAELMAEEPPEPPPVQPQPAAPPAPVRAPGPRTPVPAVPEVAVPDAPHVAAPHVAAPPPAAAAAFSVAALVPRAAGALRGRAMHVPLRPAAPPPVPLPDLEAFGERLRSGAVALGVLMVAVALLSPAWRRRPRLGSVAEAVPVRLHRRC